MAKRNDHGIEQQEPVERSEARIDVKLRLLHGDEIAMGPGKADLLEAIGQAGSISAAARQMGMSYRRAWLLVDVMNRSFAGRLVQSAAGGSQGGGASVTALGQKVLDCYRTMQTAADQATASHAGALKKLLRDDA